MIWNKKKSKRTNKNAIIVKKKKIILFDCRCSEIEAKKKFCMCCLPSKINEKDTRGHNCVFDFKKHGRQLLEKNNPKITTDKLILI